MCVHARTYEEHLCIYDIIAFFSPYGPCQGLQSSPDLRKQQGRNVRDREPRSPSSSGAGLSGPLNPRWMRFLRSESRDRAVRSYFPWFGGGLETLVLAAREVAPVGVEVAVADHRAEFPDGFGSGESPSGAGDIKAVADQVPAGARRRRGRLGLQKIAVRCLATRCRPRRCRVCGRRGLRFTRIR